VLYFTGHGLHNVYGAAYRPKEHITRDDLTVRIEHVVRHELEVILDQMQRNGIDMYYGAAHFVSPHTVEVASGPPSSTSPARKLSSPSAACRLGRRTFLSPQGALLTAMACSTCRLSPAPW